MRTSKTVGVSDGKSIELFLVETVDRLEVIREAITGGWNAVGRFRELKEYLRGDTLESYNKLVKINYPDPADKTGSTSLKKVAKGANESPLGYFWKNGA